MYMQSIKYNHQFRYLNFNGINNARVAKRTREDREKKREKGPMKTLLKFFEMNILFCGADDEAKLCITINSLRTELRK